MTDTDRQQNAATAASGSQRTESQDNNRGKQTFADLSERMRSGELKARLHYFLFRKGQEARRSDSILSRYKRRLIEEWAKWFGIGAGITGLLMLFSPEAFQLWQIPLVFILMLLAPAFFELPNTLNALFGQTQYQHLVGSTITLTQGIIDGKGSTLLEKQKWQVSGPDCRAGSLVKIITLDAKTLYVVSADQDNASNLGDDYEQ